MQTHTHTQAHTHAHIHKDSTNGVPVMQLTKTGTTVLGPMLVGGANGWCMNMFCTLLVQFVWMKLLDLDGPWLC